MCLRLEGAETRVEEREGGGAQIPQGLGEPRMELRLHLEGNGS